MMAFKVYITDRNFDSLKPEKQVLGEIDAELYDLNAKNEAEIIDKAGDADAFLVQFAKITEEVIESLPKLKVIGRYGIGVDVIDIESATKNNICVVNVPDYCIEEVADHTMGLLLGIIRKIPTQNIAMKKGRWDMSFKSIKRIRGSSLGILGFGSIPRNLVKKVSNWGLDIRVYDPFISKEIEMKYNIELTDFEKVLCCSDYISIHTPLNKKTKHLIGYEEFVKMKNSVYIINTARGSIIDEKALIKALKNNIIAGAALDVFEDEPISFDNPLLKMDNVITTPHISYYSAESEYEMQAGAAKGVVDVLQGKKPENLINKEVWKSFSL